MPQESPSVADQVIVCGYQAVMQYETTDRLGFRPPISLEAEHDWILLTFARSRSAQSMAATAANKIKPSRNAFDITTPDELAEHHRYQTLRMLAGASTDPGIIQRLTLAGVINALAAAADETLPCVFCGATTAASHEFPSGKRVPGECDRCREMTDQQSQAWQDRKDGI